MFSTRHTPSRRLAFNDEGFEAAFGGAPQALGIRLIAQDKPNSDSRKMTALNCVGERQHIRAAP
jgi:hypothetical protein